MEIRNLQTFQVVAEELNMTHSAIKLNYSQPTITKHIKSLEDELGTMLLDKKNGKYVLTYAGEELYKRTVNILSEVNLIKTIPTELGKNYVMKLQGHDFYCFNYFMPHLKTMAKDFPAVTFKIDGSNNDETIGKLLKNEIDIGIVSGNLVSSELETKIIDYEDVVLCVNSSIYRDNFEIEDYFSLYPIVIDQSEYYNYNNFFQHSLTPPRIIDSSSDEVVQEAILNGNMLGIVRSGRLQPLINSGEIKVVEELTNKEPIQVVMNKSNTNNEYISTLFDLIANHSLKDSSPKVFQWA